MHENTIFCFGYVGDDNGFELCTPNNNKAPGTGYRWVYSKNGVSVNSFIEVRFIHELQNLFKIITGKELEFNLNDK